MSDRPMRLKYETKMKIILCIFLLNITAVSVFGKPQELNGILGESVKFPAAVKKGGSLMHSGVTIGDVTSGSFTALPNEKFSGRLQWDSSTGLFSLSGLKMEDIGEYKVQDTDQNINTVFQLNVHIPVSKPHVSITHNEHPCTIECTAERGTGATLSWYREGEKKSLVSSRVASAPHLHLPESVERSGTYTCEAKNSVSNETSDPLTVGAHCTAVFGQSVELNGIVGQSVKFPAAVKKGGYLMYGTLTIGESSLETPGIGNYRDRLQWDSSTGFFSLSGLKMEDSGEYKVQNTDPIIITVFQLNVYKDNVPVSKPHVIITHNEYPCTIECTAERGTGATLSWYREGEKKPYVTSPVESAPGLHLPVPVESGTYTCEAKNSVSNEKASITVGAHCTVTDSSSTWIIVASVIAAVAVLIAVVFAVLYHHIRRRQAVRTLIQVKKHIDNVDLHGYDKTDPPDVVRTFIQVKEKLDNLDPHACGVRTLRRGVRTVIQVKKKLDNLDLHDYVKILLDNVDQHEYVKMLLDNVDVHDYDETVLPDALRILIQAVRTLIQVKILLDNVDLHDYGMFICHPEATEKITSSHETEVPLKQVTCEVGEP